MVWGALGCINNVDFEKKINDILHIVYLVHIFISVSAYGTHFDAILCKWRFSLQISRMVHFSMPVSACNSSSVHPILHDIWIITEFLSPSVLITVELSALYCSVYILQVNIQTGKHSYIVVSSFKCEGKSSCHDLIPNSRIIAFRLTA